MFTYLNRVSVVCVIFGALLLVGCQGDGLDKPDEVIERAKSLCACETKECMETLTEAITDHTARVRAKYPKEDDMPAELKSAQNESRKITMGCMTKLDQLQGRRPAPAGQPSPGESAGNRDVPPKK